MAFARYKLIKRENAKKKAKEKRLLFKAVVKARIFITKLKKKVLKARERRALEEQARLEREARNKKRIDQAKHLDKLT